HELNFHAAVGYIGKRFISTVYLSNLKTRSGLFANAHGLEPRNVNMGLHDASDRDIQHPSQYVNHFKAISKNRIDFERHRMELDLAYQNNFREEYSDYISHGFMPPNYPEGLSIPQNLERGFTKNVYSLNFRDKFVLNTHDFTIGT